MDSLLADIRTDFACPLAASYVGSSDRRTDGLGATFLFCILIIPYSLLVLKNYPIVLAKVYILFIPGGLVFHKSLRNVHSFQNVYSVENAHSVFSSKNRANL